MKKSISKTIKTVLIILVIVVAILGLNRYRKNKNRPEWRTVTSSTGDIREIVTATGSINPYVLVNVGTEVSGKIYKIYKDFNSSVRRGELLATIDTEILKTNLEAAKSDLSKAKITEQDAKIDFDLLTELAGKDMAASYEVKKAEFKHLQAIQSTMNAQISLQRAQKNLDNAYITSPIDGVVVSREVDEGQTVAASMNAPTLFKIANNLEDMQITAGVDEADIGKIKIGMPVEFTVDAHPNQNFEGSIKQIRLDPQTDQNVVSYNIIIDAKNPDRKLLPGMTANVTVIVQSKSSVLRIPESATRFRPSKELWEQFGYKWEDDFLMNASKEAMEAFAKSANRLSGGQGQANPDTPDGSLKADKQSAAQSDSTSRKGRKPGGTGTA
ncbi:MAG: efflux RND transporter periplasmic adaptor subunit, partial [Candidatus Cloacimonetes bacterium]|nr:efflux RND transporter periplasmic adaptor subunit [Candidatus Cloacimonadota bacterium]